MKNFNSIYKSILEQIDPLDNSEQDIRQFIIKVRRIFSNRNKYFGYLLDQVPIIIVPADDRDIGTMAVDGKGNLYINIKFANDLLTEQVEFYFDPNYKRDPRDPYYAGTEGQRAFTGIIAHELKHIFSNHVERMINSKRDAMVSMGGRPVSLWNLATDAEINDGLVYEWGYTLMKGGIIPEPDGTLNFNGVDIEVRGLSPERIYDRMLELVPDQDQDQPPPQPTPSNDPLDISPGDIVYDPTTKEYGEVVTIDSSGNAKIVTLTQEEAKQRAKN
jgi:hypothetical protein